MFNKYDFIIKVCELNDNVPEYNEKMSNNDFHYYRGYLKALLNVCDIFDELDN